MYTEPKVKPWQYYRSNDNKRVFHVLDINTVDFGGTGHVMVKEWGKDEIKHIPLETFTEQIEKHLIIEFRPHPIQYLFAYNIAKQR